MPELDEFFYEALNSKRISSAPIRLHESMYGEYTASETLFWKSNYTAIGGFNKRFQHEDGKMTQNFKIAYTIWEPSSVRMGKIPSNKIATLILIHGVPVKKEEWFRVSSKLARFIRVIMIDLHGMGESSKPLNFKLNRQELSAYLAQAKVNISSHARELSKTFNKTNGWIWSWKWHSEIVRHMILDWKREHPNWFSLDGKIFLGGNDWGGGVVQKFVESYGSDMLHGASLGNPIALNGYWVQHIGAFRQLAEAPYPSPEFNNASIGFVGQFTMLLESMHYRTDDIHNQYTMAWLQNPFVDVSAYSNPNINPSSTFYNPHAVRVLAEQANVALGNGELLPYHSRFNPNGIKFTLFNTPMLVLWGKQDKMMPEKQARDFANIFYHIIAIRKNNGLPNKLDYVYKIFDKAGHFSASDQPEQTADALLSFIQRVIGPQHLATTFHGFDSLARQDEKHVGEFFDKLKEELRK